MRSNFSLSVRQHKKNPDERGVPEGYVAVPGGAVVSERFTNITNTHEERDDVREEEEVHHLGQYSNEVSPGRIGTQGIHHSTARFES